MTKRFFKMLRRLCYRHRDPREVEKARKLAFGESIDFEDPDTEVDWGRVPRAEWNAMRIAAAKHKEGE